MELEEKLGSLKGFLSRFESAVIAFSGGVDSATLSALSKKVIDDVLAVTIKSANIPSREIEWAKKIAKEIGIEHRFLDFDIFSVSGFVENSELRCYYCKKSFISAIVDFALSKGYEAVFEGTNASDLNEHRPGYRAIKEFSKVFSPWADFGIKKEEIRAIARLMGFSFYKNPPLACLATRVPFGVRITPEILRIVDEAENTVIRVANVENVRVRNLEGNAVVEVESSEIPKILEKRDEIKKFLIGIGFQEVFVNPKGYRSGVFVKKFDDLVRI